MRKRKKNLKNLSRILHSVSDVIYPEELGTKKIEPDSKNSDGDTPLHVLCWRKNKEGVRTLLDAGVNVNAIGDMGETALHIAVLQSDEPITELLLKSGANPHIRSAFGETPYEKAMKKGGNIELLIKKYAYQWDSYL